MKTKVNLPSSFELAFTESVSATKQVSCSANSIEHYADAALNTFRSLVPSSVLSGTSGSQLLCERASFLELKTPGLVSANDSCHLIKSKTGWLAVNLPRIDDWELISPWLQTNETITDWQQLALLIESRDSTELIERSRLLGLSVAKYNSVKVDDWFSIVKQGKNRPVVKSTVPVVIDLSSLWAGPLCSHLLERSGATVIKIESTSRPDTTRSSAPEFHHLLNGGKASVCLDFKNPDDISVLKDLIARADIVIESSRPRALEQLGIDAVNLVETVPGLIWLSITGYGRSEPQNNWVAFGDDAAIAGGLAVVKNRELNDEELNDEEMNNGELNFIGDALADPLTGIHGAIIALKCWQLGKASLVDISLAGIASFVSQHVKHIDQINLFSAQDARAIEKFAPDLGADNNTVLEDMLCY